MRRMKEEFYEANLFGLTQKKTDEKLLVAFIKSIVLIGAGISELAQYLQF